MKRLAEQRRRQKLIAREGIRRLFSLAEKSFKANSELSDSYVQMARKLSMKTRVRIPKDLKRSFCKNCISYLKPGVNCRVRTRNGMVVYYCLKCRKYMKFPFSKARKLEK